MTPARDPTVYAQLDYLADQMTKMESHMIDPIEYGGMKAEVAAIKLKQTQMDEKLDLVLDKLSEAKGGWKTLMALGGAGATLGAMVPWIADHLKFHP